MGYRGKPRPCCSAIADVPEATLQRGLAHLQAAELLYETRLFPDQVYTSSMPSTHEVAYKASSSSAPGPACPDCGGAGDAGQ